MPVAQVAQGTNVSELLDVQRVGQLLISVLLLCTLVTLADGYNISIAAFAAPAIVKEWHLTRAALGPLFSSSLIAGLIGPYGFGVLGDRIGRRKAVLIAILIIGVFGIVCGLCTSLVPLVIARFCAGVGMSGALAVAVACINEYAPRRLRATFVTIVFSGTTFGSGIPGLTSAPLLAHFGWRSLFFVGGALPLLFAVAIYFWLPESPKHLCLKKDHHPRLDALLARLVIPGYRRDAKGSFVLGGEVNTAGFTLRPFFIGPLLFLTPLLWFGSVVDQVVFHSFNNWLPTLLTDGGLPYAKAALASALFQFVGTASGWIIMRPLDRHGMLPCVILYALSIPVVAGLGMVGANETALLVLCSLAGFCVLGLHFAQVFCVSTIYPTSIRGAGIGAFMLFARVGGTIGPLAVSSLLAQHVTQRTLFELGAVPLAMGTVAAIAVMLIYRAHYLETPAPVVLGTGAAGMDIETTPPA